MTTAQQTFAMLRNQDLWQTAEQCHRLLSQASIPYAVVGGVAVCLHGYQRNTVDLDLLIRREDQTSVRTALEPAGYKWNAEHAEFRGPAQIPVQFLLSGERSGRQSEVLLPDPASTGITLEIEGLAVLSLARLIESKLACGSGSPRRTHRDFADVVELIACNKLGRAFARHLHKSLRTTFRKLVEQSRAD